MSEFGYKGLVGYQKSYDLVKEIYKSAVKLPEYERNNIQSQIRRAVTSIPLNIAEGYGKKESKREFKRFLIIAKGSATEVEVLIELCRDFGYISEEEHERLHAKVVEVIKILSGLIKSCTERT